MSVADLFTSALSQISKGTPVWKMSVPASFHHDRSLLQVYRDLYFTNQECLLRYNQVASIEDPIERLGHLVSAILNPHVVFNHKKPFNPIFGEFIREIAEIQDQNGEVGEYQFETEKINHHPPVIAFRYAGPNFIVETSEGFETLKGLSIKPNKIDICYIHTHIIMKTPIGAFQWNQPGYRTVGFLFGEKKSGRHGKFRVVDPSGLSFEAKITLPHKLEGTLFAPDGTVIDTLSGDFRDGLVFTSTKQRWYEPVGFSKVNSFTPEEVLQHDEFSGNVWKNVSQYMRCDPPDLRNADIQKGIVETAQRERNKTRGTYKSKFGFQLPNSLARKED
jgi:hypothetical protein